MSAEAPFLSPIDIQAASIALPDPSGLFPDGRHEDGRSFYKPFVDMALEDARRVDLWRGLRDLGLVAMQVPDVQDAAIPDKYAYVDALHRYDGQLTSRARLLRVNGQLDNGGTIWNLYPGVSQAWAKNYAEKLLQMQDVMRRTRLFEYADGMRGHERVQEMRRRTVPRHDVAVCVNERTNRLVIVRSLRQVSMRRAA